MSLPLGFEDWTFDEIQLDIAPQLFPQIVETSENCFLVTALWGGTAYIVDPFPLLPMQPVSVGQYLSTMLCVPRASRTDPPTLIVATRTIEAPFWTQGASTAETCLSPQGALGSVAITANGRHAYLGTGMYPLDPHKFRQAGIELAEVLPDAESLVRRHLPGTSADQIALDELANEVYVVTGSRNQLDGHLCVLTADNLDYVDFADTNGAFCAATVLFDERIILIFPHLLESRSRSDLRDFELRKVDSKLFSAARIGNSHLVVLSTGEIIDQRLFSLGVLPMPEETTGLTSTRSGGVAAISNRGVLRVWRKPSTP